MHFRHLAFPLAAMLVLACGGDSGGNGGTGPSPTPTFESIAGTYAGSGAASSQGYLLQSDFSLTITQSQGNLTGSYSLSGQVSDGTNTVPIAGSGTLGGNIASGSNPSVNVTATNGSCTNVQTTLSGTYDSANRAISFPNVTIPLFDQNCQVMLSFTNISMTLRR